MTFSVKNKKIDISVETKDKTARDMLALTDPGDTGINCEDKVDMEDKIGSMEVEPSLIPCQTQTGT